MPTTKHSVEVGQITSVAFSGNEKFAVGKIVKGGMGIVYQLIPIRTGAAACALKTLQGIMTVRDFEHECNAWLSVTGHPNIARASAYGTWQESPAILVDWYPRSMGQLKVAECSDEYLVEFVRGIVAALNYSYTMAGLIHQDIKPSNILVDERGAPRLADFGLARCMKYGGNGKIPQRWQWNVNTSLANVPKATSGTPFYMAPELFGGASASITTDIFSLGVTLFQFLTGEHPYFSPMDDANTPLRFRKERLMRFMSARGPELVPLLDLIKRCVALDARDRPENYQATGWLDESPGIQKAKQEASPSGISAAIAQAMFHRERGDFAKADSVLRSELKKSPDDPCLLNALGGLALKRGQPGEAFDFFNRGFARLRPSAGVYRDGLYLDPVINLAGRFLAESRHGDAFRALRLAWDWKADYLNSTRPRKGEDVYLHDWYPEFGWMLLYSGDFSAACEYLATALSKKGAHHTSAYWLTESSWFGNRMKEHADYLVRNLITFASSDAAATLCACLVAQYSNARLARELQAAISPEIKREIYAAETESGLARGMLLYPTTLDAQKLIIRSVDDLITGGKHAELV